MDSGVKRNNDELADIIRKWTVDDILNEDLFMDQVREIPKTFLSVSRYFDAFRYPLLEEVRAELASCLDKISNRPRFVVCILEDDESSILLKWSDGNVTDQNFYQPEVGDMICLSTFVPSSILELNNIGAFSSFAFITDVSRFKDKQVRVKLCKPLGSRSKKLELSYVAVLLLRTAAKSHIWNTLNVNIDDPCSNLALVRRTLHAGCSVQQNCSCPLHSEFSIKEKLLKVPNLPALNDIQIKLVRKIVSTMGCSHSSLQRISGFPGTGKTEIIAIVSLMALQMEQHKLVISAPISFSVLEIVSRMMKLAGKNAFHASNIVLVGGYNNWPNFLEESPFVCLDDLIVVLEPLFSETNGWKQVMSSLLDTLGRVKCHKLKETKVLMEKLHSSAVKVSDYIHLILLYFPRSVLSEYEMICLRSLHETTTKMIEYCCNTVRPNEFCALGHACATSIRELIDTTNIPVIANSTYIESLFLEHARVIFCPVSDGRKLKKISASCRFTVLVDRACEVKECDVLPLLQLNGACHAFLFGGSGLPTAKMSKNLVPTGFYRSLFGRLSIGGRPEYNLVKQYRMHPDISHFPNNKFFKSELVNSVTYVDSELPCLPECISGAYRFIDVSDGEEITDEQDMQPKNLLEAAVICKIALKTLEACSSAGKTLGVGVISPSPAQVSTISTMLNDKINLNSSRLWVKSIDEFYSTEEDILILSTVSSRHNSSCLRLLSKAQNLIYCLTRARKYLWIVGNREIIKKCSSIWQEVVLDAEERGSLIVASREKFLSNTIIKLKGEMKQLDHLFDSGGAHFDGTKWKVLFSNDFKKSFVAIRSTLTKKIIIAYIWRLASGWRPRCKSLHFSKTIKQFKVHGLTLICTTDIIKAAKIIQTIKIWDVLTSLESPKLVRRLETMVSSFSESYLKLCKTEMLEGGLVVPMSWDTLPEAVFREVASDRGPQRKSNIESVVDDFADVQTAGLRFLKFYSLSSGNVKHLLTGCDGREIELPFEVSALEAEIISFPESAFVLGRSGTGKTLVLITKLVQREQQHMLAAEGSSSSKIELHTDFDHSEEEDCSADIGRHSFFQIFLAFNPILCSSVKNYVNQLRRYASGGGAPEKLNVVKACEAVDSLSIFSEIPNNLIEIPHHKFPLVVSLLKFLVMLDGSLKDSFFSSFSDIQLICDGQGQGRVSHVMEQLILSKEVDHDRFVSRYWPCFDVNLTKKLEPTLVFAQIVNCIKGENGSTKKAIHRNISLEEYLEKSKKRSSMFSKEKRAMIYKIFISYEDLKKRNGEYDLADLVNNLHFRLSIYGYKGPKLDYMYIDEIQDFSMKQISLFKYTCENFQSGYLFAGDTAQTLMNDFRFEDIKCWFYQEYLSGNGSKPNFFQLTTNFRTHSGILELAESVLNLLYHFFPFSLDHLASEKSQTRGEIPIILKAANEEEVLQTIFNISQESGLEFGSEQVILVRSVSDKEKVITQIGSKALVLTIKECKGLEFQDVLLYNFFSTSSLKNEWRILYKFMNHKNIASSANNTFRDFDMDKHQVLCFELKQLYVALTRTRNKLWICESDDMLAKPVFNYWMSLGLVHVQELSSIFVKRIEVKCKKEDWAIRGRKFFNEGNYEMAIVCFKKAGDVYMSNWAKAASLHADGSYNLHLNFDAAAGTLNNAAGIYLNIGKTDLAVACYMKAKKYKEAGMLYLENFDEPRFEDAGDCFALAGNWLSAAKTYAQGKRLSKCLMACVEGLRFDLGFHFLKNWPMHVSKIEWIKFTKAALKSYYKLETIGSLVKFVKSFPDDLTSVLFESGNFVEAAAIHRLKGDVLGEIDVSESAQLYEISSNLMLSYALSKMLWMDGKKGWPLRSSSDLDNILENAISVAKLVSNNSAMNSICSEAKFLLDHSANLSTLACHIYDSKPFKNICTEFVACRKILEICLETDVSRFYQERDFSIHQPIIVRNMLVEGHVSIQTFMFAWNRWKKHIEGILSYIESYGTSGITKYTKYEELCLKYFGVLKVDLKGFYVCYLSKPSWMISDDTSEGYMMAGSYISSSKFNPLAKKHCLSEISFIGESLLQKLESLHEYLLQEKSTIIFQSIVAHHFLKVRDYVKNGSFSSSKMQNSLIHFKSFLLVTFFPLNVDVETTLKILDSSLEDSATALVPVVLRNTFKSVFDLFEPMKTARFLVYLLAREISGEVIDATSEIVCRNSRWNEFFGQLSKFKSYKFHRSTSMVKKFLALPNLDLESQLSLVENVLFNVLLFETRKGWFITTSSGLSKLSKKQIVYCCQFQDLRSIVPENSRYLNHIYHFILSVARRMLRASHIRKATHDKKFDFFRYMVQRVFVLISIVCLNSPSHYTKVREILLEANGILTGLPHQFFLNFWTARKCKLLSYKLFCIAFSKAMKNVRDELVVVRFDDCTDVFDHLAPLYVDSHSTGQCAGQALTW